MGHRVTVAIPARFAATAASTGATPLVYRSLLRRALIDSPEIAARRRVLAQELRGAGGAARAADLIDTALPSRV